MRYREVIHMPLWLMALIYFFMLSFVLSVWAALGNIPALATLLALTLLLLIISRKSRLIIEVSESELRVGRAHIDLSFVGTVQVLDGPAMRKIRTRDANPYAFLAIRFWSSTGVTMELNDPRDETPYWLITSNKAKDLAVALKRN